MAGCGNCYGIDIISATDGSGAQTYFSYDGLGSTATLTDGGGNTVATYFYDAFGAIRSQTGSSPNYWQFTGEQRDSDSNLYYLRARYYDTATGRFLSQESPAGFWERSHDAESLRLFKEQPGQPDRSFWFVRRTTNHRREASVPRTGSHSARVRPLPWPHPNSHSLSIKVGRSE